MSSPRTFDHDECRALYATGEWTQAALAARYGVSDTRVWQIVDPERQQRTNRRASEWTQLHYNKPCDGCGARIWKQGHRPTQTGLCRKCWAETQRTAEHGTESRYCGGCRCAECRAASATARRNRRARVAA